MGRAHALKEHPDYKTAKAGEVEAAVRLVDDLVRPEQIAEAKERFPAGTIFMPIHAQEASGLNAIPVSLADRYAEEVGGTVDGEIAQANRTFHSGATAMERLVNRPTFFGAVEKGASYVIVDDVVTLGGTIAEVAHYIQVNGGNVLGSIVLANSSRTGTLAPSKKLILQLEERYGEDIREIFSVEPNALTAAEATYLVGFKNAESLRARAAAAVEENARRTGEGNPLFKLNDEENLDPRQRVFRALLNSKQQTKSPRGSVGGYFPRESASHREPKAQPVPQPAQTPPPNQPPPNQSFLRSIRQQAMQAMQAMQVIQIACK